MPRKTKEAQENEKEVKKKATTKKAATKKAVDKKSVEKKSTEKKVIIKKTVAKKPTEEKVVSKKTKADEPATKKVKATKTTATKKSAQVATTDQKPTAKSSTKKATTKTQKATKTTKKATTKKAAVKVATKKTSKKADIVEYYDLPYRYNQTVVKVLAQTPTTLFIYWDISDEDRENYKKQYGENFFETTRPILKIFNDTMNYSFEVDINDFANSWYLHINDAKCDYRVELGRRPIYSPADIGGTDYVYISTSNEIEAPNDRILIDKVQNMVYFRNVKTNQIIGRSFANLSFLRNMGKIYNIYDLYKELYKDEDLDDIYNPSSRFF